MSAIRTQTLVEQPLLGRYRLTKQLGSGAFGTVWAAHDERLDRPVAVKVLRRDRVIHQRFEREARAAARLQHPSIVTLYEAAVDDDGAYLVSELVRGRTLDQQLDAGRLSDREILEIGIGLCDALEHAHDQGVIHRDVKPSNILVATRSNSIHGRAKLTDFGVAHVVGGDSLTRTGDVIGTYGYMSPEQAEGREATPSSDLYSLALVLYEALTGVNPLESGRRATRGRLANFVPPLRRQRRELPRELAAGIDTALRPRPAERGTLEGLRAALVYALDGADETRGVVAGWRGHEETLVDGPGPEWDDEYEQDEAPRLRIAPTRLRTGGPLAARPVVPQPEWVPRAMAALAAGLTSAWLSVHLLTQSPLAPAAMALVAAAATLLLPRLGWVVTVVTLAVLATGQDRSGGAALLLVVCGPPIALLCFRDGWSVPGLAPALGLVGLGGGFPAFAARAGRGWWQRGTIAAAGFVWLTAAGVLAGRRLYWVEPKLPRGTGWLSDPTVMLHQVLEPALSARGLYGALVWGAAAALAPLLRTRRFLSVDIVLAGIWAAITVSATEAVGARELHGAVLGGLLAATVMAWPAILILARELRWNAGNAPPVA